MEYYPVLKKRMNSQTMKRHGGTLNAYYLVKEANVKRSGTILFDATAQCLAQDLALGSYPP